MYFDWQLTSTRYCVIPLSIFVVSIICNWSNCLSYWVHIRALLFWFIVPVFSILLISRSVSILLPQFLLKKMKFKWQQIDSEQPPFCPHDWNCGYRFSTTTINELNLWSGRQIGSLTHLRDCTELIYLGKTPICLFSNTYTILLPCGGKICLCMLHLMSSHRSPSVNSILLFWKK